LGKQKIFLRLRQGHSITECPFCSSWVREGSDWRYYTTVDGYQVDEKGIRIAN